MSDNFETMAIVASQPNALLGSNTRQRTVYRMLTVVATLLLISGMALSFATWRANRAAQAQAVRLTAQANAASGESPAIQTTRAASTTRPSSAGAASYSVAPTLPKYLNIPSLGVHSRVLQLGTLASGALATPENIYDVGWYNQSAKPGQPGATLIDGHVSSWTAHGVFYGIKTLKPGASIQIVRGDGTVYNYRVVSSQLYSSGNVDMNAAMTPITTNVSGLNLISCTGDVIPGTSEFNQRIVVFATQV